MARSKKNIRFVTTIARDLVESGRITVSTANRDSRKLAYSCVKGLDQDTLAAIMRRANADQVSGITANSGWALFHKVAVNVVMDEVCELLARMPSRHSHSVADILFRQQGTCQDARSKISNM